MLTFSVLTKYGAKKNLYCAAGWVRRVYATANGRIVITEKPGSLGGLGCDSRNSFKRPVTQQSFLKLRKQGMPPPIVMPRSGE